MVVALVPAAVRPLVAAMPLFCVAYERSLVLVSIGVGDFALAVVLVGNPRASVRKPTRLDPRSLAVPPISHDYAIVRRAISLQKTHDAAAPCAFVHSAELQRLNLKSGETVKLTQGQGSAQLSVGSDDSLPHGVVWVAAGHALTASLGAMFGEITMERA